MVKKIFDTKYKFILASGSPRRKKLLSKIIKNFEIIVPECKEFSVLKQPRDIVCDLSYQKAISVFNQIKDYDMSEKEKDYIVIIISSDTLVELDGNILGKPQNNKEAHRMLSMLQDNWHKVWTGVAILKINQCTINTKEIFYDMTHVHMSPLDDSQINSYIASGSPMDKAGAYGIQDLEGKLVDQIDGQYDTVMGFPTELVNQKIKTLIKQ